MSTSFRFAPRALGAFLTGASALLLAACGPSAAPPAGAGAGGPPGGAMPPMPVSVRTVTQQTVPVLVDAVGQAEGSKEVEVRARVGGLIERQLYAEGDQVKAGAPMFAIERAPLENALATAKAALNQEQARLEQTRREARRLKPLADIQAIAQREADDAVTAQRTAEGSVAAAQARVRDAELNLSYTAVTAPIAGISGRAEKSQGSLVSTADGLLTKVVQTDPIWVRFSFSESELAQLRSGKSSAAPVRLLNTEGAAAGAQRQAELHRQHRRRAPGHGAVARGVRQPRPGGAAGSVRQGAGAGRPAARLVGAAVGGVIDRDGQDRLDRAGWQGHADASGGGRLGRR